MIYLLDVNALIALGLINHEFHYRIPALVQSAKSPNLEGESRFGNDGGWSGEIARSPVGSVAVLPAATTRLSDSTESCLLNSRIAMIDRRSVEIRAAKQFA